MYWVPEQLDLYLFNNDRMFKVIRLHTGYGGNQNTTIVIFKVQG